MASVDEPREGDGLLDPFADEGFSEPVARRSTYTSPAAVTPSTEVVDDDALAAAMEEQLRPFTGAIPVSVPRAPKAPPASSVPQDAAPPAPWEAAPPFDVESSVPEPAGPPPAPTRRSLPDDVLARELSSASAEPGHSLEAMAELERQMLLRQEEAQEYLAWERSMRGIGTPEALAAIAEVRSEFEDVVPSAVSPTAVVPPMPPIDEPAPIEELPVDAPTPQPPPLVEPPERAQHPWTAPTYPPVVPAPEELAGLAEPAPEDPVALVEPAPQEFSWVPSAQPYQEDTIDPWADLPAPLAADAPHDDAPPLQFVEPVPSLEVPPSFEALLVEELPPSATGPGPVPPEVPDAVVEQSGSDAIEELFGVVPATGIESEPEPALEPALAVPPEVVEPTAVPGEFVEDAALHPTPDDERVGRAIRLFWIWFAPNASLLAVGLGAVLFSLGMSLRQSIIAILAGVVLSFLPLGLGSLAGRRSGQPTMIVSRATFGVRGNTVPALVALLARLFWGGAMLWLLGTSVAAVLQGAGLDDGLDAVRITRISMAAAFVIALFVVFLGSKAFVRAQLVVTIVSAVLVAGLIALTHGYVHISTALSTPDGEVTLIVTGAVLVFSVVGVVWAQSTADLARYQRPGGSGAGPMLSASFGAAVPAFVLIGYGALLAASDPVVAAGLLSNPVDTLGRMLPLWYPVPLIVGTGLSLLSGVVVSVRSGAFALGAVGVRLRQPIAMLLVAVLVFAAGWGITALSGDLLGVLRDLATTVAVPVAAWIGMFCTEVMLRNRPYHAASLLRSGGVYPAVRWGTLIAYLVICAIGFGLITATFTGLGWEGYGFRLLALPTDSGLGATDVGVLVALALGLLAPLAVSIPAIRRQESAVAEGLDPAQ